MIFSGGLQTGLTVFAVLFAAAFAGLLVRPLLPTHHRTRETQESLTLAIGMIATLSAVVLGLLTASVKGQFDAVQHQVQVYGASLEKLDGNLRTFGPGGEALRAALLRYTRGAVEETWPRGGGDGVVGSSQSTARIEALETGILELRAATPLQSELLPVLRAEMLSVVSQRWALIASSGETLSPALLIVLVFWLALIFSGLGLNSPRNALTVSVLGLSALALAALMFLTVEMDGAFEGLIRVSPDSLVSACDLMAR